MSPRGRIHGTLRGEFFAAPMSPPPATVTTIDADAVRRSIMREEVFTMATVTQSEQCPHPLNPETREIIGFALQWAPFDHGDEYILPQFGIVPRTFYRRLAEILRDSHTRLDHGVRETLTTLCRDKLRDQPSANPKEVR